MSRIDALASQVRQRGGIVVCIQHAGMAGDLFEPDTPGWQLLGTLHRARTHLVVSKTLNDPFFESDLTLTDR